MEKNIENEVNKTLLCMDKDINLPVNARFAENIARKIAGISPRRTKMYNSKAFYPAMIAIIVILNISIGLASINARQNNDVSSENQTSTLISEYGMNSTIGF